MEKQQKYSTTQANEYIRNNKHKVNRKYRHQYHVMAPIGWINDPNGFGYFNGKCHLFYQYYPYASHWGPMHWGHVVSDDFISWKDCTVAMAPDAPYDFSGCFSGSSIVVDNTLLLMYTGHTDPTGKEEDIRQVQCLAYSKDGLNFEKEANNPVISTEQIPANIRIQDFRDPKIWKQGDWYYVVIGTKSIESKGLVLFYRSKDLKNFQYFNKFYSEKCCGSVWECPDLFWLEGQDILIVSPPNLHSAVYFTGQFNYETGTYVENKVKKIDDGFDFYAPQTMRTPDGRRIMIGWMNMWGRDTAFDQEDHGWKGSMTLPRELQMINGKLYQQPVKEIENYRTNERIRNNIICHDSISFEDIQGDTIELDVSFRPHEATIFGIEVLISENEKTVLLYNRKTNEFIFDRSQSGYPFLNEEKEREDIRRVPISEQDEYHIRVFIDRSSIEIFLEDGYATLTGLVYTKEQGKKVRFFANKDMLIKTVKKWDIKVK